MTTTMTLAILAQLTLGAEPKATDPKQQEYEGLLASRRITVDFSHGETLDGAIQQLKEQLRVDIHISPKVREKHGAAADITLRMTNCTARTVLKVLLADKGLTMVFRKGVMVVVGRDEVASQTVTKVYDVRDLLHPLQMFAGPKMDFAAGDTGGTVLTGVIFDPAGDETADVITSDFLVDVVKQMTPQGRWEEDPDHVSISMANKMLVVKQTEPMQKEIDRLINQLRQYK